MISSDEWDRVAERAAAATYGEKHAGWYTFRRFHGPELTLAAVAAGGLGLGAHWAWAHARMPHSDPGHMPAAFWVLLLALILATAFAFRPGRSFVTFGLMLAKGAIFSLLWLGMAVYVFVVLI